MTQLPLRAQLASALGRSAATLSRMTGRGDGSVIGGRVGLMLEPDLLRKLAHDRKLALVHSKLQPPEFIAWWQNGRSLTPQQAEQLALTA